MIQDVWIDEKSIRKLKKRLKIMMKLLTEIAMNNFNRCLKLEDNLYSQNK
jgi:hypothetical protein